MPPNADRVVRLKPAPPSQTDVWVHPIGLFDVRQHAVPLETVVVRVGANPVPEGQRRVHLGVPLAGERPAGALSEATDLFSAGNFLDLSDDEKLSRPSFEPMPAGARIRPPGEEADWKGARHAELRYETFVCDDDTMLGIHNSALIDVLFASSKATVLASGAAGASQLRASRRYATDPDPIVLADPGEVIRVSKATLATTAGAAVRTIRMPRSRRWTPTHSCPAGGGVMPDTLKSLAGVSFKQFDVISQFHKQIPTEELVLDRYVFLPLARSGIAAALTNPFAWDSPTSATVEMKVPVLDDRGDGGLTAEMDVHVHGPADVTELDARQVIRAFPKIDAPDAEVDDLVHVEFDRPDLPWLFTPTGPDASGRLAQDHPRRERTAPHRLG